ncbi:hypothetical protein K432DRAFT_63751 [Lepidopterella palustris CBS 459.81]|uniref:Uncharacterized protein n=1 Tax=Lepidopterella palustris CBS 459.81 TaxID=1314670 RepID=A0A8E2E951_9PEZI|nr:hypothetical protein K432DRAFT_63751 [Lepidopterella palustris CBS 459.81]
MFTSPPFLIALRAKNSKPFRMQSRTSTGYCQCRFTATIFKWYASSSAHSKCSRSEFKTGGY